MSPQPHPLLPAFPPGIDGISVSQPPYRRHDLVLGDLDGHGPGNVVVVQLQLDAALRAPAPVLDAIVEIRRSARSAALLGSLAERHPQIELNLLRRTGVAGLRAFVPSDFGAGDLRLALARVGLLVSDLAVWLRMRLTESAPRSAVIGLAQLVRGDAIGEGGEEACPQALRGATCPSVHKWKMVGKLLPALHDLQMDLGLVVEKAARASPYGAPAPVTRACRNVFGFTPSEIRECLGWEWLLERFLERKGD